MFSKSTNQIAVKMETDLDVLLTRYWLPHAIQVRLVGYLDRPVGLVGLAQLADLVEVSVADRQHNQDVYTASNEQ